MEIERRGLLAAALGNRNRDVSLTRAGEDGPPLAVPAVENEHPVARFEPQHVAQIVGLAPVERNAHSRAKCGVGVEPGCAEIVSRHGPLVRFGRCGATPQAWISMGGATESD